MVLHHTVTIVDERVEECIIDTSYELLSVSAYDLGNYEYHFQLAVL